ncbi:galactokinase [Shewanella intestini]|uniref:Galactokinase n=1 Tax=Shewanella intestini TaxID=2017544 RepID=A0ABS5I6D1_9GAMM|nr:MULTISPECIES: galactokinase [Shewanella]MBR9729583.1 galactokinase [Shewanella intestini]MRG37653.1 galactokinase [Shewanella sp. XMDDZSB0408]
MSNPAQRATKLFVQTFGTATDELYQAPGRINIIGEHSDYNEGLVLPVAINFHTVIAVKHRDDFMFRAVSDVFPGQIEQWEFGQEGDIIDDGHWHHYLKGITAAMAQSGLSAKGLDLAIVGNVPLGAGLSSSAALEIAFGTAISYADQLHLSPLAIAQIAQRAESQLMRQECGIMDQMISALAEPDHALLIDCLALDSEPIKIPDSLSLIVIDPQLNRKQFTQQFFDRKQECKQITELLGLDSLRDLTHLQLQRAKQILSTTQYHRALHVMTETQRTASAARALNEDNIVRFSELMRHSHHSLRENFDVVDPLVDTLVSSINELIGDNGGVRMSDGCIIVLVNHSLTDKVINLVETQYHQQTGKDAIIHLCSASKGASRI